MNKNRPVNLDLATIKFPITAIGSITHRITGVVMLFGVLVLMWLLDASLRSPESFDEVKMLLSHWLAKLVMWGILSVLGYHFCAGVRHLLMDWGFGETYEGGRLGAKITFACAAILVLLAGWWIW